jgi:hypothetical protein
MTLVAVASLPENTAVTVEANGLDHEPVGHQDLLAGVAFRAIPRKAERDRVSVTRQAAILELRLDEGADGVRC